MFAKFLGNDFSSTYTVIFATFVIISFHIVEIQSKPSADYIEKSVEMQFNLLNKFGKLYSITTPPTTTLSSSQDSKRCKFLLLPKINWLMPFISNDIFQQTRICKSMATTTTTTTVATKTAQDIHNILEKIRRKKRCNYSKNGHRIRHNRICNSLGLTQVRL